MSQAALPKQLGATRVMPARTRSIIGPANGFIAAYDGVINPYVGCSFGCDYCYAANFTSDPQGAPWGQWVQAKTNAQDLLLSARPGRLNNQRIYMATATDPYQPLERQTGITRRILETLLDRHPLVKLVIQTRSPLVTRDVDLLQQFNQSGGRIQVNITVTTDDEATRRAFEPGCPSIPARLRATAQLADAGVQTAITVTPMLPVTDPDDLAERLLSTGCQRFIIQPFHQPQDGRARVARTQQQAMTSLERHYQSDRRQAQTQYLSNSEPP